MPQTRLTLIDTSSWIEALRRGGRAEVVQNRDVSAERSLITSILALPPVVENLSHEFLVAQAPRQTYLIANSLRNSAGATILMSP